MGVKTWAVVGCIVGLACYLVAYRKHKSYPLRSAYECPLAGALIAGGLHLLCGVVFDAALLVHIVDKKTGAISHDDRLVVQIGELHTIELFCAGVATVILGLAMLRRGLTEKK